MAKMCIVKLENDNSFVFFSKDGKILAVRNLGRRYDDYCISEDFDFSKIQKGQLLEFYYYCSEDVRKIERLKSDYLIASIKVVNIS